jgi:DNA-binding CsgD family transcriptional regulator
VSIETSKLSVIETDTGPRLLGRERELAELGRFLATSAVHGGALLVRGGPGNGTSTLMLAARRLARRQGARILRGAGVRSEMGLPFAALHQILRPLFDRTGALPRPQRDALLSTFGMRELVARDGFLSALGALELIAQEARHRPVVLAIDDAHWLDRPTANLLTFVARRLGREPIALLVALHDGHESRLAHFGWSELRVGPLDIEASGTLVDRAAPDLDPLLRQSVLDAAAGNPLAVIELSAAVRPGPSAPFSELGELPITPRLAKAFLERWDDLPEPTRALLLVASADKTASLSELLSAAAMLVRHERVSVDDLRPAETAALITRDHLQLVFRHALVPAAIYQTAESADRHQAHAALAAALSHVPERQTWHRAAAATGPDEVVAERLEREWSTRSGIGGRAILGALQRAAELTPDPVRRSGRLLRAAELAVEVGQRGRAGDLLGQIDAARSGALDQLSGALVRSMLEPLAPPDPRWVGRLLTGATLAVEEGDHSLALRTLEAATVRSWWTDPGLQAGRCIARAVEHVAAPGDIRSLCILAIADPPRHAAALREVAMRTGPDCYDAKLACSLGTALYQTGALDISMTFLSLAVEGLRAQGWLGLLPEALVQQAWCAAQRGDWTLALGAGEEGETLARKTGQRVWLAAAQSLLSMVAAVHGDDERAWTLLSQAEAEALPATARPVLSDIQGTRALAAIGQGRYEEAFQQLQRTFDPSDPAYHHFRSLLLIGDYVEAALHIGRSDDVWDDLERAEEVAAHSGSPQLRAALAYARALQPGDDDATSSATGLSSELSKWPLYRARLLLEHGTWLRRRRKLAEARTPLRAARDAFDALGAAPWAVRAREQLRATRETQHKKREAWMELTEQERQIAALAAEGLSNREIGQRLYISHRTVGSHLYRIFPKLGIATRAQLPAAIRDDGVPA